MQLFVINNVDYTKHITVPSWKVNSFDIYETWEDGNWVTHREKHRSKVKGTFTMYFDDITEFDNFMNALQTQKTSEGYIIATVYVTNLNTTKSGNFYIDCDPANNKPLFDKTRHDGFDVTIEER